MISHGKTYKKTTFLVFLGSFFIYLGYQGHKPILMAVGASLLCLVFTFFFYLFFAFRSLSITRILPKVIFENQECLVQISLTYTFFLPLKGVCLKDFFGPSHALQDSFLIPYLKKGTYSFQYMEKCKRGRGFFFVGPLQLQFSDPLGLWIQKKEKGIREKIIVLPEISFLPTLDFQGTKDSFFSNSRSIPKSGLSFDFLGVREYRTGDPLKYIHWPATAHRGKLIIKEFQKDVSSRVTFFLDLSREALEGLKPNTLDYSARIVASLGKQLCEQSVEFRMIAFGKNEYLLPFGKGENHLRWMLEMLAFMKPLGKKPLEEVIQNYAHLFQMGDEIILIISTHMMKLDQYIDVFTILQSKKIFLRVILLLSSSFEQLSYSQEIENFLVLENLPKLLQARGIQVFVVEKRRELSACFKKYL